ncbi:MAG: hypothetical protein K6G13_01995 [Agathobacter sp.]|nr:hypothetical protein [Agathobacter sp.]
MPSGQIGMVSGSYANPRDDDAAFDISKQYVVYTRVAATSSTPWSDISAKTSEFRFHEHHWNYYAQGNAIYAYCDGEIYQEDCAYIGRDHAISVNVGAPAKKLIPFITRLKQEAMRPFTVLQP